MSAPAKSPFSGSIPVAPASVPAPRRIAIAAGGTAGHVTIGLAIARAYKSLHDPVSILFLGTGRAMERRLVEASEFEHECLTAAPVVGEPLLGKIRALWNLQRGVGEAVAHLEAHGSELVVGVGGYASVGALLAARRMGLPRVIHEANAVPGLGNRVLSRFADRVYLGFPEAAAALGATNCHYTGIPVRPEFSDGATVRMPAIGRPSRIFVTGGSQGSAFLNARVPELVRMLHERGLAVEVDHQVGEHDPEPVLASYRAIGVEANVARYMVDMRAAYTRATFVIACPGAATLAELSAHGVPALLVPRAGAAADHQTANAIAYSDRTRGMWSAEEAWNAATLADRIGELLRDPVALAGAEREARHFANHSAGFQLVHDCEQLIAVKA